MSGGRAARSLALFGGAAFVPGVTTHYGALRFAGHGSHAELFGVFRVSILLNVVHVLVGAIGIVTARTTTSVVGSLALWLLGVLAAGAWLSLDVADNWLHFVLAIVLLGVGSLVGRTAARAVTA